MKNGALNKRVLWLAASLLMMVAIALSATGEKEVEEGRLELVTAEAELGNERFNWILQTGTGVRVMISPYLETLLTLEEQAKPGLAERSEVSDDGLTRTFYLRRGAKFHNGDEVTADDVVFSVEHAMSEDAVYTIWRHSIEGVEAVDKYTAKIQFKIPMAGFPQRSTIEAPIFIVPKNYIEENGWDYFEDHPVGSGPYKVIDYSPGYSIKYEAWEEYWGDVPAFHYYTVLVVPEETTKVSMFRAGELDVIGASLPTALELAKEGFELQKTGAGRQATLQFMGTQLPEAQNLPIADPRVRRALGLAIDSQGIIDEYFMGRASVGRVHGAVPWLISEQDHEYWWKYAREKYYYDLEEAKRLLDDRGVPMENRTSVITATGLSDMLGTTEATSSDYNTVKALVQGELDTFVGFKWIIIESRDEGGLPKPSTQTSYCYHQQSMGLAVGLEFRTEVNYIPEKTSWLCNGIYKAGSVDIDALGIVEVSTTE